MSVKTDRQSKIIELVNSKDIETQDELCDLLRSAGFNVTQATICRDVKELGLYKTSCEGNRYKYVYLDNSRGTAPKMGLLFKESVVRIYRAENLLVIKTISGSANAAAAFIDVLNLDHIVGCIAGDDTIFVAIDKTENVAKTYDKLNEFLR